MAVAYFKVLYHISKLGSEETSCKRPYRDTISSP
jgi:hypothetical protein